MIAPRDLDKTDRQNFTAVHHVEMMEICGDFSGTIATSSENRCRFKTFLS